MTLASRKGSQMWRSLPLLTIVTALVASACGGGSGPNVERGDQSIQLCEGSSDGKYWLEFARLESAGTPETR